MNINLLSSNIIEDVQNELLNKIQILVKRRAQLFQNMNLYSLNQLTKLIEEINRQLQITVKETNILSIEDVGTVTSDNFMSICDSKITKDQTIVEEHKSVSSKISDSYKRRRLSIIARSERSEMDPSKAISFYQNRTMFIPLKNGSGEEDSREIEAYREMKKKQFEDRAKKLAEEIFNRQRTPINLDNQRVMFDFDGSLTKLQKQKDGKQRKFKSVPAIYSSVRQLQYDQKKKRKYMKQLISRNPPAMIKQKHNITRKQVAAELQKKNKRSYNKKETQPAQSDSSTNPLRINLESHKEHEQAINVKQAGVKITIKDHEFGVERDSNRTITKINRRLSRSEYIQFKNDEEKKKMIKNSHARFIQKIKIKPQEPKVQPPSQVKPVVVQPEKKKEYKLALSLDHEQSSRDRSKLYVHNILGRAQLIKQVKQKNYLTQPIQQPRQEKDSLSKIDKYNLLYIKYNGNPPDSVYENATKQLQTQRVDSEKSKDNVINLHLNKRKSAFRESQFGTSRKN